MRKKQDLPGLSRLSYALLSISKDSWRQRSFKRLQFLTFQPQLFHEFRLLHLQAFLSHKDLCHLCIRRRHTVGMQRVLDEDVPLPVIAAAASPCSLALDLT